MVENIKQRWDTYRWCHNSLRYGMRWATGATCVVWVFWSARTAIAAGACGLTLGFILGTINEIKRCQKQ
jgi:hypothetical protein